MAHWRRRCRVGRWFRADGICTCCGCAICEAITVVFILCIFPDGPVPLCSARGSATFPFREGLWITAGASFLRILECPPIPATSEVDSPQKCCQADEQRNGQPGAQAPRLITSCSGQLFPTPVRANPRQQRLATQRGCLEHITAKLPMITEWHGRDRIGAGGFAWSLFDQKWVVRG